MNIYHYDPTTGALMGQGLADPDPLVHGNWLIPAFATTIVPPAPSAGNIQVFQSGVWGYVSVTTPSAPTPTPQGPSEADYTTAVQLVIDGAAVAKQFANGVTLASYKDSTVAAWAAQATTFIAWRDQVWTFVYAQLAAVTAGTEAQPTIQQLISGLPAISWPS